MIASEAQRKTIIPAKDRLDKAFFNGFILNKVTSSNASRLASYWERLSGSIVLLLFLSSVAPSFLIGEKQGSSHQVHLLGSLSFILLVSLVVFVTLDLNQPHRGLIKVSQDSLEMVIRSMGN